MNKFIFVFLILISLFLFDFNKNKMRNKTLHIIENFDTIQNNELLIPTIMVDSSNSNQMLIENEIEFAYINNITGQKEK